MTDWIKHKKYQKHTSTSNLKHGELVLVKHGESVCDAQVYICPEYGFIIFNDVEGDIISGVTHWMIPAPPEGL